MAVRRLAAEQPATFELTSENAAWAAAKITDYPQGRQASAVIPILWKAQEQHGGWLPEPAIRLVADMLDLPYIRVFEIATFYTMFQLQPVGTVAHIGVCGTTPCMLRGADDLVEVCKSRIAPHAFERSADGRLSWEVVECAGACVNAPMVQVGSDTYEDLTVESFGALIDLLASGGTPKPGPQSARRGSEPITGLTTLTSPRRHDHPEEAAAPADATPDANVDPSSPAAGGESAGRPSGADRPEVEATRSGPGNEARRETVAPEPQTSGQTGDPDAAVKQNSAFGDDDPDDGDEGPSTPAANDEGEAAPAATIGPNDDGAMSPSTGHGGDVGGAVPANTRDAGGEGGAMPAATLATDDDGEARPAITPAADDGDGDATGTVRHGGDAVETSAPDVPPDRSVADRPLPGGDAADALDHGPAELHSVESGTTDGTAELAATSAQSMPDTANAITTDHATEEAPSVVAGTAMATTQEDAADAAVIAAAQSDDAAAAAEAQIPRAADAQSPDDELQAQGAEAGIQGSEARIPGVEVKGQEDELQTPGAEAHIHAVDAQDQEDELQTGADGPRTQGAEAQTQDGEHQVEAAAPQTQGDEPGTKAVHPQSAHDHDRPWGEAAHADGQASPETASWAPVADPADGRENAVRSDDAEDAAAADRPSSVGSAASAAEDANQASRPPHGSAPIASHDASPSTAATAGDASDQPEAPNPAAAIRANEVGRRPEARAVDDVGEGDDLQRISGIGPVIRKSLNGLGIYTYAQIAAWDQANTDWVNAYLAFKGRIDRERWVEQARTLSGDASG